MENNLKEKISLVISSFDAYSDLWYPQTEMLNNNWGNRNCDTYLITDKQNNNSYKDVEIIACGDHLDFSGRLKLALKKVKTPYVLFILDDYLLNSQIDNYKILQNILFMESNNVEYLRMYTVPHRNIFKPISNKLDIIPINHPYAINLYPAIWNTKTLSSSINSDISAWEFEVSLTSYFRNNNKIAYYSNGKEFPFMNAVVKGKFFNKPYKYLKENNLYFGDREVLSKKEELFYRIKRLTSLIIPRFILNIFKKILNIFGIKFYS